MSNSNSIREFPLDDQMREHKFKRVYVNLSTKQLFVENGKASVTSDYTGELETTIDRLRQKLLETPEFEQRVVEIILRFVSNSWRRQSEAELAAVLNGELEVQKEDGQNEKKKRTCLYIQKYTTDIHPAEAILINGIQPRLLQIVDGKAKLSKEIELPSSDDDADIILRPLPKWSYISKEYEFSSEEEINNYIRRVEGKSFDELYNWVKSVWKKYIDADDVHIVICTADTFFTYFQDKLGTTHYLLFVGDNDVGKSNNLTVFQNLGYRALCDIDITPANIYRFLGSVEEGQGIILEDEVDDIDDQREKKKLYQGGYNSGKKVTRSDDAPSGGRQPRSYYVYGFKAFTAEKQPDSFKSKGFNERTFVINCFAGDPKYDISEIIKAADNGELKAQYDELVDVRKCLLIFRLLHYNDPIPDVRLDIKNRDKQLCKPLIRLFRNTKALGEIKQSLLKLLQEKKDRKLNTVHAIVYKILTGLVEAESKKSLDKDVVILTFSQIWNAFVTKVDGIRSDKHLKSIDTTDYGLISQQEVSKILSSRFGGGDARTKDAKKLKFSRAKLEKLYRNYSTIDKIGIIEEGEENKQMGDPGDQGDPVMENRDSSDRPSSRILRSVAYE